MTVDVGILVVSEATPSGNISSDPSMDDWVWLKPSTGVWYNYDADTSQWVEVGHLHPTLGDIEFEGTITVDGDEGITGNYTNPTRITVKNGIVTRIDVA